MNTVTSIRKLVRLMHAAARASLGVAAIVAIVQDPQPAADAAEVIAVAPAAVAAPAAVTAPAPAIPEGALRTETPMASGRPVKCGDLPRAPWNTCVALHDHEI
jgi:hypothetical protein